MELKFIFSLAFIPDNDEIFAKSSKFRKIELVEIKAQFVLMELFSVGANCFFILFFNELLIPDTLWKQP